MKFEDISYNFSVAKVLAILTVASGHFFKGFWWAPVTNALFVFAFSSGFFTSKKYNGTYSKKKFWAAKLSRLLYPILVIDVFLLALLTLKKADGINTWDTIPSLFGLNGFLDWFGIVNHSPFGAGLWFFTLLILFYILYPIILTINKYKTFAVVCLILSLITTYTLYYLVHFNHALWLCSFAFVFGVFAARFNFKIHPYISLSCFIFSYFLMLYLSFFQDFKSLNYFFINISSISLVLYLLNKRLPNLLLEKFLILSGCAIEIYFIHTYLFIEFTRYHLVNYLLSMLIIITVAYILSMITQKLRTEFAPKLKETFAK